MYLRESRRTNRDGSMVRYLQLAHNERRTDTGSPVAKVIHNFGRADRVDRDALARLVSSISRFLEPEAAVAAAAGAEVEVLDSRRLGGAWTLDRLWDRLGIGAAIRRVAAGRRLDGEVVERVVFALVAQRALEPASKLEATRWVAQRVAVEGCAGFDADAAYAAMDFLLDALDEIASETFSSVAHLLNLDLDIVFVDTTSTYWETETADDDLDLADLDLADPVADDEHASPAESGMRAFGHSKDHRADLPQVVIAMAVTRDGVPVRCWTFAGDTADQAIIRTIKDDLGGWGLRRLVWVADRGFASAANRAYLTRGGGHYIHAEKLRATNTEATAALARPGRYRTVADNLRVKEVAVAPGGDGDGDDGARAQRLVICHNPEQGERDQQVRNNLITHLQQLIDGSDGWTPRRRDEFGGSLKTKPGLRRYLRRTRAGLLRIDHGAAKREAHLDGKWLLRTSDTTL
ncbi:MAG: IS1634 family transposase, partial [Pseudonocardiaceae bacterium]|nr:IS1634 family transposase [Pseudonocardiaceae bacterium]